MLKLIATAALTLTAGLTLAAGALTTETGARVLEHPAAFFNRSEARTASDVYPTQTAPEHMEARARIERMLTEDVDARLQPQHLSYNLVVADLSSWGAAGMVDFREDPNTLYIEPGTASGDEDSLLWVLTHEAAHVRQFEAYGVAGMSWLDSRRLDRLKEDAHEVFPEAEDGIHAVEMLADCMAASAFPSEAEAHGTAYLDDPSICEEPDVAAATQSLLDGERLSSWGW